MRKEKQDARRKLIEAAAYEILAERGYRSSSMLLIAKRAKASNETLYRWYGSKQGLFAALVDENSRHLKNGLRAQLDEQSDPIDTLTRFGPSLLEMVTAPRAIALNRAAAAEADGGSTTETLGEAISKSSQETIMPLIEQVFREAAQRGYCANELVPEISQTYLSLLIGDLQIRRVIGVQEALSEEQCRYRAKQALAQTMNLYALKAQA